MASETAHDEEVRDLAAMLISKHGVRAPAFATHQALKARQDGDDRMADMWREIADIAEGILRTDPDYE
jgi:hypothetical protein